MNVSVKVVYGGRVIEEVVTVNKPSDVAAAVQEAMKRFRKNNKDVSFFEDGYRIQIDKAD